MRETECGLRDKKTERNDEWAFCPWRIDLLVVQSPRVQRYRDDGLPEPHVAGSSSENSGNRSSRDSWPVGCATLQPVADDTVCAFAILIDTAGSFSRWATHETGRHGRQELTRDGIDGASNSALP